MLLMAVLIRPMPLLRKSLAKARERKAKVKGIVTFG
jgi:hypothetical protein